MGRGYRDQCAFGKWSGIVPGTKGQVGIGIQLKTHIGILATFFGVEMGFRGQGSDANILGFVPCSSESRGACLWRHFVNKIHHTLKSVSPHKILCKMMSILFFGESNVNTGPIEGKQTFREWHICVLEA